MKRLFAALCLFASATSVLAYDSGMLRALDERFEITDFASTHFACAADKSDQCLYGREMRMQLDYYSEMREVFKNICMPATKEVRISQTECELPVFVEAANRKTDSAAVTKQVSSVFKRARVFYDKKATVAEKKTFDDNMAKWMILHAKSKYQRNAAFALSGLAMEPFSLAGQPLGQMDDSVLECSKHVDCKFYDSSRNALRAYAKLVDLTNEICNLSSPPALGKEQWCAVSNTPTSFRNNVRMMYVFNTALKSFMFENGLCGAFGRPCEQGNKILDKEIEIASAAKEYAVAYDVMAARRGEVDGYRLPLVSFIDPEKSAFPVFSKHQLKCLKNDNCFGIMERVKQPLTALAAEAESACKVAVKAGLGDFSRCGNFGNSIPSAIIKSYELSISTAVESKRLVLSGALNDEMLEELIRANAALLNTAEKLYAVGFSVSMGDGSLDMGDSEPEEK